MRTTDSGISYGMLLVDFLPYAALYLFVVIWKHDRACLWGSMVAIPGFILWFIAKLQLGSSFTVTAQARKLVTYGLYSKIRNPIYFFSTFVLLGIAICLHNRIFYLLVAVMIPFQWARARAEQKVLREKFGHEYEDYRRRTWF